MEATQIAHWPGKDEPVCDTHLQQLVGVGEALGLRISWTPCEPTTCNNCANEQKKLERQP